MLQLKQRFAFEAVLKGPNLALRHYFEFLLWHYGYKAFSKLRQRKILTDKALARLLTFHQSRTAALRLSGFARDERDAEA
jgi:hypothetical protein